MAYTVELGVKDWIFEFVGASWAYRNGVIIGEKYAGFFSDPEFIEALEWASRAAQPLGFMYDWRHRNSGGGRPFQVGDRDKCAANIEEAVEAIATAKELIREGAVIYDEDGDNVLEEARIFAKTAQESFEHSIRELVEAERMYILKRNSDPVYIRDCGLCRYCGADVSRHYVKDHVHPKSKGGSNRIENMALACSECNSKKGAKTPEQAGMVLREIP